MHDNDDDDDDQKMRDIVRKLDAKYRNELRNMRADSVWPDGHVFPLRLRRVIFRLSGRIV